MAHSTHKSDRRVHHICTSVHRPKLCKSSDHWQIPYVRVLSICIFDNIAVDGSRALPFTAQVVVLTSHIPMPNCCDRSFALAGDQRGASRDRSCGSGVDADLAADVGMVEFNEEAGGIVGAELGEPFVRAKFRSRHTAARHRRYSHSHPVAHSPTFGCIVSRIYAGTNDRE